MELRQWKSVLYTDESRFPLTQRDARQRVWRRRGEQYMQHIVQEGDRFGQGSVMVWGGISTDGLTDLVRSNVTVAGVHQVDTATACIGCCIRTYTTLKLSN